MLLPSGIQIYFFNQQSGFFLVYLIYCVLIFLFSQSWPPVNLIVSFCSLKYLKYIFPKSFFCCAESILYSPGSLTTITDHVLNLSPVWWKGSPRNSLSRIWNHWPRVSSLYNSFMWHRNSVLRHFLNFVFWGFQMNLPNLILTNVPFLLQVLYLSMHDKCCPGMNNRHMKVEIPKS